MTGEFIEKTVGDKYRIESLLRKGELGDIYRGRHLFMDKPVTLKILSPALAFDENMRQRFSAEARNAVLISHPNILGVSDFGTASDGTVYIVFEGFEGETLQDKLNREGQFSLERVTRIVSQIAAALTEAGASNVISGKLNPENILVSANENDGETVKIFDFSSSENGQVFIERDAYSVAYVAPEQFSILSNTDSRSDVYSLGIIAYQMLTGNLPFKGETPTDIMLKHTEEPPPALAAFRPDLPASTEPVLLKALSKNPDIRYQTVHEFAAALDQVSHSTSPSGNNIWKTAFIVLAGISILAAAMIYATSVKQTVPATVLQPDANGQPVQPINPSTGIEEQNLASMPGVSLDNMSNSNMAQPPGTLPGGDNYNPWGNGGIPPAGAPPTYVAPGGQVYTIDPNNPSQFMPPDGVILVPVPVNTNTTVKPTPTPRTPAANTNVSVTPPTKPAPEFKGTPAREPAMPTKTPAKPAANKPSPSEPEGK